MSERLTVCCFPLFLKDNAYLKVINRELASRGVHLTDFHWLISSFQRADIFHMQWPDAVVMGRSTLGALAKLVLLLASAIVFWLRGIPIVYTVNNIRSHDQRHPIIEFALWRSLLPLVNTFIHMNSSSERAMKANYRISPSARHLYIPHPHYRPTLRRTFTREQSRRSMDLSAASTVFLNVGLIRPYKGLESLIGAFRDVSDGRARLIIAGRPVDDDYLNRLKQLVDDARVTIDAKFLNDEELEQYLAACDIVVLAHCKLNNSGVAMLALSCDRPILAPATGVVLDLRACVGGEWVICYGDEGLDAAVLEAAASIRSSLPRDARPNLVTYDPSLVAAAILKVYLNCVRHAATSKFTKIGINDE